MSELFAILARVREERARGTKVVHLATLVGTEGSTYRRPGARTLFVPDGSEKGYATVGLVSGGCVEADLALRRREVGPRTELHGYDLDADGDALFGLGLGCKGKLAITLERIALDGPSSVFDALASRVESGKNPGHLVHFLDPARLGEHAFADSLEEARAAAYGTSAFVESLPRRVRIVVFGAGPDVTPLLEIVGTLGWERLVVDHRPGLLATLPDGLAEEKRAASVDALASVAASVVADAVVVMTHHFEADAEVLRGLAAGRASSTSSLSYVGLLGPAHRRDDLLATLDAASRTTFGALVAGPAGLDLGGDGPEAVALAVAAEAHAVIKKRDARPLRARVGAIHETEASEEIVALVLAAGESKRFGGAKALAPMGCTTLLGHVLAELRRTPEVANVTVLAGARADAIAHAASALGARVVLHSEWSRGMTSSLRAAVADAKARNARAVLVCAVDQPSATREHFSSMIAAFRAEASLVASGYAGTSGVPVLFGRTHFDEVLRLADDERGKDILDRHRAALRVVPLERGDHDVDTRQDLDAANAPRLVEGAP